jgi:hypothetical protein
VRLEREALEDAKTDSGHHGPCLEHPEQRVEDRNRHQAGGERQAFDE